VGAASAKRASAGRDARAQGANAGAGQGPRAGAGVRLREPYADGISCRLKKTVIIDETLLSEARAACNASTDTDTIRLGLEALVRHGAHQRLRALRGSEPAAVDVPRRRPKNGRRGAAIVNCSGPRKSHTRTFWFLCAHAGFTVAESVGRMRIFWRPP